MGDFKIPMTGIGHLSLWPFSRKEVEAIPNGKDSHEAWLHRGYFYSRDISGKEVGAIPNGIDSREAWAHRGYFYG
jgi:hypothetical protein